MRVLGVLVVLALSLGVGCRGSHSKNSSGPNEEGGAAGVANLTGATGNSEGEPGKGSGGVAGAGAIHATAGTTVHGAAGQPAFAIGGASYSEAGSASQPGGGAAAGQDTPIDRAGAAGVVGATGGRASTGGTTSIPSAAGTAGTIEACDVGYRKGPNACEDIDECADQRDDCDPNATCTNTPGSWSCSCNDGYFGNGQECLAAQPCAINSCLNGGDCWVEGSTRRCECPEGFSGKVCEVTCPEILTFGDPALETAVRAELGQPDGDILLADAREVTALSVYDSELSDLSGIQCLTGLTWLNLVRTGIGDLSPLSGLVALTHLDLGCNDFTDLSPLEGLVNLAELSMGHDSSCVYDSRVSNLSALDGMSQLTTLSAYGNAIVDLRPLAGLRTLTYIQLADNPELEDVSPLQDLSALETLGLSNTSVNDVSPLARIASLRSLDLTHVGLSTLEKLRVTTQLTELDLAFNELVDISKLVLFTDLTHLYLDSNPITDLSPLSANTGLDSGDTVSLIGIAGDCAGADVATLEGRGVNVSCSTK